MKLAIGSAQFGLRYGLSGNQVEAAEAAMIVKQAWSAGIDTLDTAIDYGESERVLGHIGVADWRIVSKLPGLPNLVTDVESWVDAAIRGSLDRLRVKCLYGFLLHRPLDLLGAYGADIYRSLCRAKEMGKIGKIGISIYDTAELDALLHLFPIDLVQAPFNVVDRRLAVSGWLSRLHSSGIEVHVRSIFLQGALLKARQSIPAMFAAHRSKWEAWHDFLQDHNVSAVQACLGFVKKFPEIQRIVVGIESYRQLQDLLLVADSSVYDVPVEISSNDMNLINPTFWTSK